MDQFDAVDWLCAIRRADQLWSLGVGHKPPTQGKKIPFNDDSFELDWFKIFLSQWRLSRSVKKGNVPNLLEFVNNNFVPGLRKSKDRKAFIVCCHGEKHDFSGLVSLMSKIGFFFYPTELSIWDSTARAGLTNTSWNNFNNYRNYVEAFNDQIKMYQDKLERNINLYSKLNARMAWPNHTDHKEAFIRTVFDNYLMLLGGRWG